MIVIQDIRKGEFAKLNVNFYSILRGKLPANRRPVTIKSLADGEVAFQIDGRLAKLLKGDKPTLYFVVYEPDVVDTQNDWASAEVIKQAAYDFLKNGNINMIDENHNFISGAGKVVESFILNSTDDDRFIGVRKGAWVIGVEPSDDLMPHLDEITGGSLAGTGIYKAASDGDKKPVVRTAAMRARNFNTRARARQ